MADDEWKKEEDEIVVFENEGDNVYGELVAVEKSATFDNQVYKIKQDDKIKTVFGTTVLDSRLVTKKIGDQIKIVFTGTKENKKKGQNPIKLFDVYGK